MLINFCGGVGSRWTQEWNFRYKDVTQKTKFPDWNIDDIAIAVFDC